MPGVGMDKILFYFIIIKFVLQNVLSYLIQRTIPGAVLRVLYLPTFNIFQFLVACRTLSCCHSDLIIIAFGLLSFSVKELVFIYLFHFNVLQYGLSPAIHIKQLLSTSNQMQLLLLPQKTHDL